MEAKGIPPTTPKPAPVKFSWEIVTAAVPVFVSVRVWGLLHPITTFPKFKFVGLAARVPDDVPGEFVFAAGVPAPVKPVQPAIDSTARHPRINENMPNGTRRSEVT
jgi:hypothetical protein